MNTPITTIKTRSTARPLSMSGIKRRNAKAGHRFFSPANTRYWSSCYYTPTSAAASGLHTLFVTSETAFPDQPETRKFTVRRFAHASCTIFDVSVFMEYDTLADAVSAMRQMAKAL